MDAAPKSHRSDSLFIAGTMGVLLLAYLMSQFDFAARILALVLMACHVAVSAWIGWLWIRIYLSGHPNRRVTGSTFIQRNLLLIIVVVPLVLACISLVAFGDWTNDDRMTVTMCLAASSLGAFIEIAAIPSSISAWRLSALIERENYPAAMELLNAKLNRPDVEYSVLLSAGSVHLKMGQTDRGFQLLEQGLAKSPRDWLTLNNVAAEYSSQKRFDEALILIDEAVAKNPESLALQWNRCWLLLEIGRIEEAREMWPQVRELPGQLGELDPQQDRFFVETWSMMRAAFGDPHE
jgi:tetratricopeptide (TPR) repeat protein